MNEETRGLFRTLEDRAADPDAFARLRQQLLRHHFDSVEPSSLAWLLPLQDQIDQANAINGSPGRALSGLLTDVTDHLEAIDALLQRIRDIADRTLKKS